MQRKCIAIIGVGLIGGSLAIRLHEKKLAGRLLGVDSNPEHARVALERELVDEIVSLEEAIAQADVLILSIPVDSMLQLLPKILDQINQQMVIDLGSTKAQLIEAVKDHPRRGRFVATHPMWGTEFSGPAAAQKEAYTNKAVIICNSDETDADVLDWTRSMYRKIGMHLLEMEGKAHDLYAAYVSHISHITSFALANTVLEKEQEEQAIFEMASAGFESTVRLAKSNPSMWVPIFLQNRNHVLDVLKEHIEQLMQFRQQLETADAEGLRKLMEKANGIRRILRS